MATLLFIGTHGTEDPTRATIPFHLGKGAVEAGHEVAIVLAGDAPVILKDGIRDSLFGVGVPPLKELFQFALENNIPVYT